MIVNFMTLLARKEEIRDRHIHISLMSVLIKHPCEKFGRSYAD